MGLGGVEMRLDYITISDKKNGTNNVTAEGFPNINQNYQRIISQMHVTTKLKMLKKTTTVNTLIAIETT